MNHLCFAALTSVQLQVSECLSQLRESLVEEEVQIVYCPHVAQHILQKHNELLIIRGLY